MFSWKGNYISFNDNKYHENYKILLRKKSSSRNKTERSFMKAFSKHMNKYRNKLEWKSIEINGCHFCFEVNEHYIIYEEKW